MRFIEVVCDNCDVGIDNLIVFSDEKYTDSSSLWIFSNKKWYEVCSKKCFYSILKKEKKKNKSDTVRVRISSSPPI